MLSWFKKLMFRNYLSKKYSLVPEECDLIVKLFTHFRISGKYRDYLQRDYFTQLLYKIYSLEELPEAFPPREKIDSLLLSIDSKLFPMGNGKKIFQTTNDLGINLPTLMIAYAPGKHYKGTIFDIEAESLSVRLHDRADLSLFKPGMEVLLKISNDNTGTYECLTNIRSFDKHPLPIVKLNHQKLIHQEKRRYIRYDINISISLVISEDQPPQVIQVPAQLSNLSVGGLQFFTNFFVDENKVVTVELPFQDEELELPLKIISRRFNIASKEYTYHSAFQGVTPEEQMQLEYFIKFHRER